MIRREATRISLTMADVLALDDDPQRQTRNPHSSPQQPSQHGHGVQYQQTPQQQLLQSNSSSPKRNAGSDVSESSSPFSNTAFPATGAAGAGGAGGSSVQPSARAVGNH
ncbi:uncharacterized protein V2V93DRAFT_388594 [Kockiozyma suomiensis]|uniref:uncharacterized protein n=1 Tax=Kockiozyma suomiensis TaxID=1337062 RepID=UPI003343A6AF